MDDVEVRMAQIKEMKNPSTPDIQKYVRYLTNVKKLTDEQILADLEHWPSGSVEKAIKEVERENQKPRPKRYYVSLKEPLEDANLR